MKSNFLAAIYKIIKVSSLSLGIFFYLQNFEVSAEESNISKFSIEGLRIGDRADDHFTGSQLGKAILGGYENLPFKGFYVHGFPKREPKTDYDYNFKEYDYVTVITAQKDGMTFELRAITGLIYYSDISECYVKTDSLVRELRSIFKSAKILGPTVMNHQSDPSGKSIFERTVINFEEGFARVTCYDMADTMNNSQDALTVELISSEVNNWLSVQ